MAEESTSGLDAINPGAVVKSAPVKGGISVPGSNMLDSTQTEQLLAQMQELINQRSKKDAFQEAAEDIQSIGRGKYQERQTQKNQEAQDLFNMRSQMATIRGNQAMQQNQARSLDTLMGVNQQPQPGMGQQPQPGMGQQPQQPQQSAPSITKVPDPILKSMAAHKAVGDYTGAQKVYDDWAKEDANAISQAGYNAAGNTQQKYFINGQLVDMTPNEYMRLPADKKSQVQVVNAPVAKVAMPASNAPITAGPSVNNPGNVRPIGSKTNFQNPATFEEGWKVMDDNLKAYGAKGRNTIESILSNWAPQKDEKGNIINDTPAYIKDVSTRLSVDPKQPLNLEDPRVRHALGTAIMLHEKGPGNIFTAPGMRPVPTPAPITAQNPQAAGVAPRNRAEYEQQKELEKKLAEAGIETEAKRQQAINSAKSQSITEERKKAGEFISKIEENGKRAGDIALASNQVIDHATRRPGDFGITEHAGVLPAVVGSVTHLPYVGGSLDKAYAKLALPEESIRERNKTDTNAQKLGLDFAQQMFAGSGARLGAALEKMAIDAKGVGTQYTAESNIMNSAVIRAAAQKAKEQSALWNQYKTSHENADPYEFLQTPENQAIEDKYENQLKQNFPKYFNDKTIPPKVGEERPTKSGRMSVWDGKQWVYK
jgi:hypothetical protein